MYRIEAYEQIKGGVDAEDPHGPEIRSDEYDFHKEVSSDLVQGLVAANNAIQERRGLGPRRRFSYLIRVYRENGGPPPLMTLCLKDDGWDPVFPLGKDRLSEDEVDVACQINQVLSGEKSET